jgi:hypothetical protein
MGEDFQVSRLGESILWGSASAITLSHGIVRRKGRGAKAGTRAKDDRGMSTGRFYLTHCVTSAM